LPSILEPQLWTGGPCRRNAVVGAELFARIAPPYRAKGDIEVRLEFHTDAQGRRALDGSVEGEIAAECQICLREMRVPVRAKFGFTLVANEAEGRLLPPERDYLVEGGERIALRDLVEDEFLLALPMIPAHDEGQCAVGRSAEADRRNRPFAGLASLLNAERKPG
jgi:uncharacterized protein